MTERSVSIKIGVDGSENAIAQLLAIRKQRDALLGKSNINLKVDASGLENARRASQAVRKETAGAFRDLNTLGGAVAGKAVAPLAEYQKLLGGAVQASRVFGVAALGALKGASGEFQRQKTLAQFWGTSGYLAQGVQAFKGSLASFVMGGGSGFSGWLKSSTASIAEYRTALLGASAVLVGFAAVAAMKSKTTTNLINSTLDSRLMGRKLSDKAGAEKWIQGAQTDDWSEGRQARLGVFQTILSKNKQINQDLAQKRTEDIEKFFFANQEMLKGKGIGSAEQLASKISAPELVGDDATNFEDIFGLGFSKLLPQARLARLSTEAPNDDEMAKAMAARPDVIMSKRLEATTASIGDSVLPVLNTVLGAFLDVSDAVGKIPGLGPMIGWGAVLTGAATGGLVLLGVLGSMVPGLITMIGLVKGLSVAQYAQAAASYVVAAAQWIMNAAMTANPLGIAIVAIAALIVVLYALEKKYGLVTKAWKMFAESSVGQGVFATIEGGRKMLAGLLQTLDSVYKKGGMGGVLKFAVDAMSFVIPAVALAKIALMLVEFLRKLWVNSNILNKIMQWGATLWQKMADFLNWLWSGITGMIGWLRDGLGITKREKEAKLLKTSEEIAKANGQVDRGGNPIPYVWMSTESGGSGWYKKGTDYGSSSAAKLIDPAQINRMQMAQEAVDKAPKGFFEGIPGITDLTKAIEGLTYAMQHPVAAAQEAAKGAAGFANDNLPGKAGREASKPQDTAVEAAGYRNGPDGWQVRMANGEWADATSPEDIAAAEKIWDDAATKPQPKMSRGGQVKATGSLIGHGGEEMDPASVVAGGETTLQRINKMFSGMSGSSMGSGQAININAPISIQVEKMDSNTDIQAVASKLGEEFDRRLLFRLRGDLDNLSRRSIGYDRG